MDMYRFVAVCENDSTSKQLTYTPENFEGVKISQEFSFVPPYGFTPKFAVDTMRVIKDDSVWFNNKNTVFGYFLKLKLQVSKLNADGLTYSHFLNLVVNSDTIQKTKDFTEFSVDVVNSATDYFNTKSTKKSYDLNFINKTSGRLKYNNVKLSIDSNDFSAFNDVSILPFVNAGDSIIYDSDTSLLPLNESYPNEYIYKAGGTNALLSMIASYNINIKYDVDEVPTGNLIKQNKKIDIYFVATYDGSSSREIPNTKKTAYYDDINKRFTFDVQQNEFIFMNGNECLYMLFVPDVEINSLLQKVNFDISINLRKETNIPFNTTYFKSKSLNGIFTDIFGAISMPEIDLQITSDEEIVGKTGKITFASKDFIRETSIALGLLFNFSENETKIERIDDYFPRLYANDRIIIHTYKDLTISNFDKMYSSVSFGIEKEENEDILYYLDFQKKMTFSQEKANGENMDLSLSKLNVNAETLSNRAIKGSIVGEKSNDKFYIANFRSRMFQMVGGLFSIIDDITPRDILKNHRHILALYFQNYNNNVLGISDNDGLMYTIFERFVHDGIITYEGQHDDFTPLMPITTTPHLIPIVYEFTALVGEADFSEHFAEMVDFNGDTVDLFVYSSETTDKLGEIKCKGLVFK